MSTPEQLVKRYFNWSAAKITGMYFALLAVATVLIWHNKFSDYAFGFEYGSMAEALASGKGFSSPFGGERVPSAWCPPVYVGVQALVFSIFGIKSIASYWVILIFRVFLMSYTFWLLLHISYSQKLNRYRNLLLPIFLFFSLLIVAKEFDDKALNVFGSVLVIYLYAKIMEKGYRPYIVPLIVLALLLPFSNLFLLIGVASLLLLDIVVRFRSKTSYMPLSLSAVMLGAMLLSTVTWGIRNQRVLGKFIPFKSNLWFEVYLSNVVDEDGVIRQSNWYQAHPAANKFVRQEYTRKGELAFLQSYEEISKRTLREEPAALIRKILRRAQHAFLFTTSSNDTGPVQPSAITPEDLATLNAAFFIHKGKWLNFNQSEDDFRHSLAALALSDKGLVVNEWLARKKAFQRSIYKHPVNFLVGIMLAFVPALCTLLCLFYRPIRKNYVFRITLFFLMLSLAPYVLLSHYARYQFFQIGFLTLLLFFFTAHWLGRWERVRTKNRAAAAAATVS